MPAVTRAATVLHVITGLNTGGAEMVLARLLAHPTMSAGGLGHEVLSLLPVGAVADRLQASGVPLHSIDMERGWPGPIKLANLAGIVRRVRPAIIQGWMYHGNMAGLVGRALQMRRPPLLWNMRHSLADIAREPSRTRAVIRLGARFSAVPEAIIYNSAVAARQHEAIGYRNDNSIVIPNGFDCQVFAPRVGADSMLRRKFGIRRDATVVAQVARAHPMKSVDVLVAAVRRARAAGHDLHLLLVGNGMDKPDRALAEALAQLPADKVTLAGEQRDVSEWLPGVDILVVASSWGEGFPNILGEAMASGVACIATDVGDSATILDKTGLVVPPGNADAIATAHGRLDRLGRLGRQMLGQAARHRIVENYSLDHVAARYADLYGRFAASRLGGGLLFSGADLLQPELPATPEVKSNGTAKMVQAKRGGGATPLVRAAERSLGTAAARVMAPAKTTPAAWMAPAKTTPAVWTIAPAKTTPARRDANAAQSAGPPPPGGVHPVRAFRRWLPI